VNTEGTPKKLAIIGAGGIGSNLAELLIPALIRLEITTIISCLDGDAVEKGNLGHQRYLDSEIGRKKVDALFQRLRLMHRLELEGKQTQSRIGKASERILEAVKIDEKGYPKKKEFIKNYKTHLAKIKAQHILEPIGENLRHKEQLSEFDLIVVCVDRPEPRRLVHESGKPWIDLRCTGDGWMVLTSDSNPTLVEKMTPDHEPKSCQIAGALDSGNLEFGFAVAAAFGAQWVIQTLRGQQAPVQSMGSLTYGAFNFPSIPEVNA